MNFRNAGEGHALTLGIDSLPRHIVQTENNILRRYDDRLAICRGQDVVGRHHQGPRFQLRLYRKWHMDSHLVAIKVGIEGGTNQGVKLNSLALDKHGLECLNT